MREVQKRKEKKKKRMKRECRDGEAGRIKEE